MSKLVLLLFTLGMLAPALFVQGVFPSTQPSTRPSTQPTRPTSMSVADEEDEFTDAQIEFFENKVRPLLVEHCYDCHGPDADPPEGGLSLASRKGILAGGDSGPGIDLGDLADSNILSAVQYGDLFQMPPDSKLEAADVQIIRQWVMDKAPWPADSDIDVARAEQFDLQKRKSEHWCWQPIGTSTPPTVANKSWPLDPIDNFILSKLESANLSAAKPADRRVWLRRVTFDITGLPPKTEEIANFLNDDSEDAFENVVDRLLASPRYGERWARHWMDLIRYAETCGHEFDYPLPYAHRYRDYLIRAFNTDVPYNDFVVEHIAGDLIKNPRRNPENQINESILGTGFWFLGEATHGPVDVKGDEAGRVDNQIDVMGKTFLGLTIACARCHDHKFDAISAEDYYGIAGFLQSSRRQNVMLDPHRKIEALHARATAASAEIASKVEGFLRTLDDGRHNFVIHNAYMAAAITFLQQDQSWLLPERLILEGESLEEIEKSNGNARRQDINDWNGGGQIWWTDANVGDELELEFETPLAGNYELFARLTKAPDYGIVQVSVNGDEVGKPIDLYDKEVTRSEEISLGKFDFDEGPHELRFKITGKNENADARYMVGLDYLVLKGETETANETDETTRIQALCEAGILDQPRLRNWINAIKQPATTRIDHPFYVLRKSAESDIDLNSDNGDDFYRDLYGELGELKLANEKWIKELSTPLDASSGTDLSDWDKQGFAFHTEYQKGQLNFNDPSLIWSDETMAPHSGLLGNKFQGVLRSPTFEITSPNIYYHVSARNAQIRLIIDGFRMDVNNELLFKDMNLNVNTDGQWKWIRQSGDLKNYIGHNAFIEIIDQGEGSIGVQEVRFSDDPIPDQRPSPVSVSRHQDLLVEGNWHNARYNEGRTPLQIVTASMAISMQAAEMYSAADATVSDPQLFNFMLDHELIPAAEPLYATLKTEIGVAREQWKTIDETVPAPTLAIGMVDGTPEDEFVFIRGNHKNLGATVSRAPITALNSNRHLNDRELESSGRMDLAVNMIGSEHPLTRRVIVNRIWHHLTGQGLVPSVDNFGVLGNKPTHPELLDFLANEFAADGWSIKRLIRRITLSQTYRMASTSDADATTDDPKNDLLHKFRIRRLQGEAIRDSMLAVSGQIDEKMFGPSAPVHLTPFMQGRGRPGKSGPLDGQRRRSIYVAVRRNFLSPMMLAFDTPIPFNSIGRRSNSNVPAQALILLNHPLVIDQAEKWARKLIKDHAAPDERLSFAFEQATGRAPMETEIAQFNLFLKTQAEFYGDESNETQLWTDVCHVLFNLKEFIYLQ